VGEQAECSSYGLPSGEERWVHWSKGRIVNLCILLTKLLDIVIGLFCGRVGAFTLCEGTKLPAMPVRNARMRQPLP
jgi:hypothetical protein